jgi:hypothetical protein
MELLTDESLPGSGRIARDLQGPVARSLLRVARWRMREKQDRRAFSVGAYTLDGHASLRGRRSNCSLLLPEIASPCMSGGLTTYSHR